jgi:hypothetical protein
MAFRSHLDNQDTFFISRSLTNHACKILLYKVALTGSRGSDLDIPLERFQLQQD